MTIDTIDQTESIITRDLVPERQRADLVDSLFGLSFPLQLEPYVYTTASSLSSDYWGAYWNFHSLSNGGLYMAPDDDQDFHVKCANGYEGAMSADTFGITGARTLSRTCRSRRAATWRVSMRACTTHCVITRWSIRRWSPSPRRPTDATRDSRGAAASRPDRHVGRLARMARHRGVPSPADTKVGVPVATRARPATEALPLGSRNCPCAWSIVATGFAPRVDGDKFIATHEGSFTGRCVCLLPRSRSLGNWVLHSDAAHAKVAFTVAASLASASQA